MKKRSLHIVITAGPTREHFDPVRFISNASSGRMGYALAASARDAGHRVTLISGPVALQPPSSITTIQVVSAAQMAAATKQAFERADVAVFAAAVSDFRPVKTAASKGPKSSRTRAVLLKPTVDIAAMIGQLKGRRVTVGFALEDHAGRARAQRKLRKKNFDGIVLNGPANIGSDRASAEFLDRTGRWARWPRQTKTALARRIIRTIEALVDRAGSSR